MKVIPLATTWVTGYLQAEREYGYDFWQRPESSEADALAEFAGRLCYKSFDRPRPATAANKDYLANIIKQQHFSVLEHASATFLVRGASRSLLAELTRHRHLSFSVVSQRYVDYANTEPVIPPALRNTPLEAELRREYEILLNEYKALVDQLLYRGLPRKKAKEAARSILPNAAPVDLVVTGNLRAWREVVAKRNSPAADAEIQELATALLAELRTIAPSTFQDFGE